jgi:hypothetical protein
MTVMITMRICLILLTLLGLLAGCKSNSNDTDTATVPAVTNVAPTARVVSPLTVQTGTTAQLNGSASSDPEGRPLTYNWVLTGKPAGSASLLKNEHTAKPTLTPDLVGRYTATLTVSDGSKSSKPVTTIIDAVAAASLSISVDSAEPLSETVQLSLSGAPKIYPVTWYVDLNPLGPGSDNAIVWDTSAVSNGEHLITAIVQLSVGQTIEVRRTVNVVNSSITLSSKVSRTGGTINVDIMASSPYGIRSVAATFDDRSAGELTVPNACSRVCDSGNDAYRFMINATVAGSGNHILVATVTDGTGSQRQLTVSVTITNAPVLTLSTPEDGSFVQGHLNLNGSYTTDVPGAVTVTASLGNVQFLSTTAQNFSASYDLSGLPAGAYTLTVKAVNSAKATRTLTRTIIVSSSAAHVYSPLMQLGEFGRLLAVEGDYMLYTLDSQVMRLHHTPTRNEVVLKGVIANAKDWQMTGGYVYAYGDGGDCADAKLCIYQWDAAGNRKNLSTDNPGGGFSQSHPVARDGYVVWINDLNFYTVYNVATAAYTQIDRPAGAAYSGNWQYDLVVKDGVVSFFYWAQTDGSGSTSMFDIFRWTSDTGVSTRLSTPGMRSVYPKTDGERVAWRQSSVPMSPDNEIYTLIEQTLPDGSPVIVSAALTDFALRDGILAWSESGGTGGGIKASTRTSVTTVSALTSSRLYGTDDGRVVYAEAGKIYDWNVASGLKTRRIDAIPQEVMLSGNRLYFHIGQSRTLYTLVLE